MTGDGPYTLREVAQMTGLSLRSVEKGCRDGTIQHTRKGDGTKKIHRVMTRAQVDKLIADRAIGGTPPPPPEPQPANELAEAIQAARRHLARYPGRRRVA